MRRTDIKAAGIFFVLLSGLFLTVLPGNAMEPAETKVTIRVTDEAGAAVQKASVSIGFRSNFHKEGGTMSQGITDSEGLYPATGESHGDIWYSAKKEGYYDTNGEYTEWMISGTVVGGKWNPWNPIIDAVIRKVGNPVPMYAKVFRKPLPIFGNPFGFDLEKADWVEPYGKGRISDLIFRASRRYESYRNFEIQLEMTFSNEGDGIQSVTTVPYRKGGSFLRIRTAPESGYQSKWVKKIGNSPDTGTYNLEQDKSMNYIFRVRTALNKDGSVRSANYGKIQEDILIEGYAYEKIGIMFMSYFNPDGTRNLEFDIKNNLFKELGSFEDPYIP